MVFQRLMDSVLDGLTHSNAYIDDVVVARSTWKEHLLHLRNTLTHIRDAGYTVKAKKCIWDCAVVSFLDIKERFPLSPPR